MTVLDSAGEGGGGGGIGGNLLLVVVAAALLHIRMHVLDVAVVLGSCCGSCSRMIRVHVQQWGRECYMAGLDSGSGAADGIGALPLRVAFAE